MKNRISRKRISKGFVLLFLALFLSLTGAKICLSQIQDSSFEEGIVGEKPKWWEFTSKEASGQIMVDGTQKHWGEHSLKMSLDNLFAPNGEIKLRLLTTLYPRPGSECLFQFYAKLEKPELGGFGTRIEIKINNIEKPIMLQATPPWDKITEWNMYEAKFTIPREQNAYETEISIHRSLVTGIVWLDDIQFVTISSAPPVVLAPNQARQGEKIIIKGVNFPILQEVKISFQGGQIIQTPKLQTDETGSFSTQVEIPKVELGHYSIEVLAGSYVAHTGIQILPPLEPKIFGVKIQVLKKDKTPKVFKDGKIIIGSDETLIIEASGETDGKTKDSGFKASFYIKGGTPETTVENKIVYERLPMTLTEPKLGIYRAELKPRSNLEITSRVTIELSRSEKTNILESEQITFQTILVPGKIESVSINDSLIIIDEVLFITLIGEPGQKSSVSLFDQLTSSDFISSISLKETGTGTGVYKAEYKPAPEKQAENLIVIGKLGSETKDAVEMVTINTKKPEIQVSIDKPQGYGNGEEVWIFVKTDPDSTISADVSSLDSTNPTVKFIQDAVRKGSFVANFIISKNNKADDGKKIISIKVVNLVGNKNAADLTVVLKNKKDTEQVEVIIPEGLSILSLPLNPGDWTLKDLTGAIGEELVMILFSEKSKFIPYLPSVITDTNANRKIEIGIGYILVMTKQKKVIFQGKSWAVKPASAAVAGVPDYWIESIISSVESLPWSESVEIALGFLYKLKPRQTTLFQNFPNPFNAETWIPFQLSEPVDVEIEIYTANGSLVRKLVLGRKNTGVYKNRESAAYWNGKNDQDEKITSGVYFYTLKTGNFTTTRKMVVVE